MKIKYLFMYLMPLVSLGQQLGSGLYYPSVNSQSLIKPIDIPVSLYTGIPQINIPLYTLKGKTIAIPISLSYHASGVRVNDIASWVGLGWSLNAGGVITRVVRGLPDDFINKIDTDNNNMSRYGYNSEFNKVNTLYDHILEYGLNVIKGEEDSWPPSEYVTEANTDKMLSGELDMEPDLYYFNFNGYSGKFVLKQNLAHNEQDVVFISKQNISIKPVFNTGTNTLNQVVKWIVTTPDGVIYTFGTTETTFISSKTQEEYDNNTSKDGLDYTSSWYLDNITSLDGDHVDFKYLRDAATTNSTVRENSDDIWGSATKTVCFIIQDHFLSQAFLPNPNDPNSGTRFTPTNNPPSAIIKNYDYVKVEAPVRLSSIISNFGSVDFNVNATTVRLDIDNNSKSLDNMKVYDLSNNLIKQYNFGYDYFSSDAGNCQTNDILCKRLKLNSVSLINQTGTNHATHTFGYNTTPVARRLSYKQDFWGYYNNNTASTLISKLIATYSDGSTINLPGADRTVNLTNSQAGVLNSITYPGGANSQFEFELNDFYDKDNQVNVNIGGLRIKKITSYDGFKNSTIKNYTYKDISNVSNSSGEVYAAAAFEGTYKSELISVTYSQTDICVTSLYYLHARRSSTFINTGAENFVGYTYVKEQIPTQGYTISKFTNYDDRPDQTLSLATDYTLTAMDPYSFYYTGPAISRVEERGLLLQKTTYDNSNVLKTQTENTYSYDNNQNGVSFRTIMGVKWLDLKFNGLFPFSFYYDNFYWTYLSKTIQRNYESNSTVPIITTADYVYSPLHLQPINITTTLPDGRKTITQNLYPRDYDFSWSFIKNLQDNKVDNVIIEQIKLRQEANSTTPKVTDAILNEYDADVLNPKLLRTSQLETDLPINGSTFQQSNFLNFGSVTPNYFLTSALINTQYITPNKFFKSPLYKTKLNYDSYDGYLNLEQYHREADIPQATIWGYSSFYNDINNMQQVSGTYLPIAEVTNAYRNNVAYTSFESDNDIEWDYLGNAVSDINAKTGKMVIRGGSIRKSGIPACSTSSGGTCNYKLSFWLKGLGNLNLNLVGSTQVFHNTDASKWTYYEAILTNNQVLNLSLTLTPNFYLDELRLQPENSFMTTYTYAPLIGATSVTNAQNITTYYEFDGLNRLRLVRDQDKNILKKMEYNIKP